MNDLLTIINVINGRNQLIQNMIEKKTKDIKSKEIRTKHKNIKDDNLLKYLEYKQIIGPSSLVAYKINFNNKILLFFRDVHIEPEQKCNQLCDVLNNKCIWIGDLLKDLFTVAPMCIDFFCETTKWLQIQAKNINITEDMVNIKKVKKKVDKIKSLDFFEGIMKTNTEFMDCLSPFKQGCDLYKNTRFHNIEFRRFALKYYDFTTGKKNFFNYPLYYLFKPIVDKIQQDVKYIDLIGNTYDNNIRSCLGNIDKYKNILIALLDNDVNKLSLNIEQIYRYFDIYNDYKNYFRPDILSKHSPYPKINKQIKALKPEYQNYLREYIMKRYDDIEKNYVVNIKKIVINQYINDVTMVRLIKLLDDFYTDFAVLIFDTYAIARMMKAIFNYNDSSLIITYAGSYHIEHYEFFFNNFCKTFNMNINMIAAIGKSNDESGCIQLNEQWEKIIEQLQEAFNDPGKCAIKEGIPFETSVIL